MDWLQGQEASRAAEGQARRLQVKGGMYQEEVHE